MIQANQLKIGNWVKSNLSGRYFQVTAADILDISQNPTLAEPIPPTEEILLKIGFKKVVEEFEGYSNFVYELVIDTFTKIIIQSDFSFGLESKDNANESICFTNDILKSIHRIQNIVFVLTEKELIINL